MSGIHQFFWDMTPDQRLVLVETPMDRYECCHHCPHAPRHDGHPDRCESIGCPGGKRTGEPT